MKLTRKERGLLGLSLIFSAFVLIIVFIITCIRKRNLLAAIAAVAAVDVAAGWWFLNRTKKNNGYAFDFFDEDDYEDLPEIKNNQNKNQKPMSGEDRPEIKD